MLVVSFFTPNYYPHVARLRTSCRASGLRFWVEEIEDRGSWLANCAAKGDFVLRALEASSESILWLDADAEVRRSLHVLESSLATKDFAVYRDGPMFRSGTVYFGRSPAAMALAREWADRCRADPKMIDQIHLARAWDELGEGMDAEWLSIGYCHRFDEDPGVDDPHIVHHQASRTMRKRA